ncbi:MAG: PilN domain-containing protein, partial [Clostridia bacterium]|nr:PilN domain-containing protein [Clostridia bacterium]
VNIENITTVTSIIGQKIYDINIIDSGISEILARINTKENSYAKAYEICKNSTIYTSEGKDLQYEENAYLDDIMPTLYNIVGQVKKILNDSLNKIDKIYITGMASVINNIDIYFQEYLEDVTCEILRPYFIKSIGTEINIKDYIEVNSAIALALQGLGEGLKGINFKKESVSDKLPDWLTMEIGGKSGRYSSNINGGFSFSLKGELAESERSLIRGAIGILVLIVIYAILSNFLFGEMQKKIDEVAVEGIAVENQKVAMDNDKLRVDEKTAEYTELIQNIQEKAQTDSESRRLKYSIPTLLQKIMSSIPVNVQLTSITNSGTKVTITAQSDRYEQLGIFIAKLNQDGILVNVVSDTSSKQNEVVTVTIEGELP